MIEAIPEPREERVNRLVVYLLTTHGTRWKTNKNCFWCSSLPLSNFFFFSLFQWKFRRKAAARWRIAVAYKIPSIRPPMVVGPITIHCRVIDVPRFALDGWLSLTCASPMGKDRFDFVRSYLTRLWCHSRVSRRSRIANSMQLAIRNDSIRFMARLWQLSHLRNSSLDMNFYERSPCSFF